MCYFFPLDLHAFHGSKIFKKCFLILREMYVSVPLYPQPWADPRLKALGQTLLLAECRQWGILPAWTPCCKSQEGVVMLWAGYHESGWGNTYVVSGSGPDGQSTEKMKSIFKAIKQGPICFSRASAFYPKGGCGPIFFFLCSVFLFTVLVKAEIAITLCLVWDKQTCTPAVTHCTPCFLVHWSFNCVLFTLWRDKHVSLILPINIVL